MRVVYTGGEGEITEKKSHFIATVKPVQSEEETYRRISAYHCPSASAHQQVRCRIPDSVRTLIRDSHFFP